MLQKTKALVLNSIKYGDSDLIVHCFTRDFGLKSYYLKGVLSSKKSKLKRSFFMPLNQIEIVGYYNNTGKLNSIKEVSFVVHYQELHTDLIKQSITFFLSEIIANTLQEAQTDENMFDFLSDSFHFLDMEKKASNFHLTFLSQFIKFLGFYPKMDQVSEYFDLVEGKFSDNPQSNLYLTEPKLSLFLEVLKSDYTGVSNLQLSRIQRAEILDQLLLYMSLHVHNFKKPKSIAVFKELFA